MIPYAQGSAGIKVKLGLSGKAGGIAPQFSGRVTFMQRTLPMQGLRIGWAPGPPYRYPGMAHLDDHGQTRLALAALFAALAQTLSEQDKRFAATFASKLDGFCREMENEAYPPQLTVQTLRWTGDLLRAR
jgi:hypothetical protein